MLRLMLFTQWKWSKLELGLYSVIAFVVPVIVMKALTLGDTATTGIIPISSLLSASAGTGVILLIVAALCAVSLAVRPWMTDHARGYVFALSLPLRWSAFVRLRFLAGAALLLAPALGVWFGGILAAAALPIPSSLHAYPTSIAARFLGSALVLYGAAFAFQYLAGRRAVKLAAGGLIALVVVELIAQMMHVASPSVILWNAATTWPGPFSVMTSRWMLIDA